MAKEKGNLIYLILLSIIIFSSEFFFYFIKMDNTRNVDVCVFMVLLLLILSINKVRHYKKYKYKFKYMIFIILLLTVITSFISHYAYGQDIINIINATRYMLVYFLYFAILPNIENEKILKNTQGLLMVLGFIFCILAIMQFYCGSSKTILPGIRLGYRLDEVRFFAGYTVVIPSFFIALSRIFSKGDMIKKIMYIFIDFIEFYYILYVTKTRNLLAAVAITIVVVLLLQKKFKHIFKVAIFSLVILVTYFVFKNSLNQIVELMFNDTTGTGASRIGTIEFVLENIKKSPVLGLGMYSANFLQVPREVHVDIGFFGFFFEFGIIGLIWALLMIFKIFKSVRYLYKNDINRSYVYIGYFVYNIVISIFTCAFNYREMLLYFIIFLAMLEYDVKKVRKRRYESEAFS